MQTTLIEVYALIRRNVPTLPARESLLQARIVAYGDAADRAELLASVELQKHWFTRLGMHVTRLCIPILSQRKKNSIARRNARFRAAYSAAITRFD